LLAAGERRLKNIGIKLDHNNNNNNSLETKSGSSYRQLVAFEKRIMSSKTVHLLDYVAGNVRSLVNAIEKVGFTVVWIKDPKDLQSAEVREPFIFPYTSWWLKLQRIMPFSSSQCYMDEVYS